MGRHNTVCPRIKSDAEDPIPWRRNCGACCGGTRVQQPAAVFGGCRHGRAVRAEYGTSNPICVFGDPLGAAVVNGPDDCRIVVRSTDDLVPDRAEGDAFDAPDMMAQNADFSPV